MTRPGSIPATAGGAHASRPLLALLGAALVLSGCGPKDTDPGPGGVTVGEARALDEAAEMLEQQRSAPAAQASPKDEAAPSG